MKHAFVDAGLDPRDVGFDIAIAKYLNSGGTIKGALRRLEIAAARMLGEGHDRVAASHPAAAQTRQPLEEGGATRSLPHGQNVSAPSSSSTNRGGEGQLGGALPRQSGIALPAREPVRPATTSRGLASIISAQAAVKRGYLILMKTSDGRPWGRVGWHELDGMKRDGAMAQLIKSKVNPPKNQFASLDEIITDSQFKEIHDAAQQQIAAV